MGFLINADRVRADPARVEVVRDWPVLCSVTAVRAFLGFLDFAITIADPLVELTSAQPTFQWGDRQQKSFNYLRNMLIDGPLLPHPDPNPLCKLIFYMDASLTGLGVVSQVVNGQERVLAYVSQTLITYQ